ncbi:MAG: EamA family transporter [Clostridia bacterium]|nr:EamA family transporter [Clostridia bacterium]
MWIIYAFGSALLAGLTSILAKCGIRKTDSNTATAIRTIIVLIFSWIMVLIEGSHRTIPSVGTKAWIFLILSGIATGISWLCYFRALQLGDINKVVPIDKSSTVLTIVLALIFLGEGITWIKLVAVALISTGTYLMIHRQDTNAGNPKSKAWFIYAVLSAIFASLTTILAKIGIENVESNLGTAIRTFIVLIMAWIVVLVSGKQHTIKDIPKEELVFICLSGIATGGSWLCYYKALQNGYASVVVPIDKLSIVVTIAFSYFVFKEKLSKRALTGLLLIIAGTLAMLINT